MRAAIDDVHHGHRQGIGSGAAQVAIERGALRHRGRARRRHGNRQDGVGAQTSLVGGAVERDHGRIDLALLGGVLAVQSGRDLAVDMAGRFQAALAEVARLVPVPQFHGFVLAGGCARWHGRPSHTAVREIDIRFHSGIPAGIQNLSSNYFYNRRQSITPYLRSMWDRLHSPTTVTPPSVT